MTPAPPSPLVARLLEREGDRNLAVAFDGGEASHAELLEGAGRAAHALLAGRASLAGERVALLGPPSAAWVAAFFGVILAGGVALPLSPLHPEAEVRYFLGDAGARTLLLDRSLAGRAAWGEGLRVGWLGELGPGGAPWPDAARSLGPDRVALMLYTSGTTGRPKGAEITHANVAVQAALLAEAWGFTPGDRLLHALPLHHAHGLGISLLTALLAGASARLLPRFEPVRVWDELGASTALMAVPTMYHRLLEAHDAADPPTRERWTASARALRLCTSGSAALPVPLAARWQKVAGQIPLERFGMTEIGVGFSNPLSGERRAGTVGRPLPTVEVRLVADGGLPAPPGEPGEIWVRGPSVFAGYFGREQATRQAFTDGWFRTGDTAQISPDGYVKILGRTSVDILKSGGYKLSALEIEDALLGHEAVGEAAVVGLPDDALGERVVAAVVARPGREGELGEAGLRAFCRERLAPYKVPRAFVILPSLPRNALGKVMKPELQRILSPVW